VEGPAIEARLYRRLARRDRFPAYRARVGYAFSAERGQYGLEVEQPLVRGHRVSIGGGVYRSFLPFFYAEEAVSSFENSASALFFHRDYWDWYEAEGFRALTTLRASSQVAVRLGYTREDERALSNHADWSVFRQAADFETNPSIPEGTYRGLDASVDWDTRPRYEDDVLASRGSWDRVETWVRASWERGNGGLGGDFDLWKATADLRAYVRLSRRGTLSARVLAGAGDAHGGTLPPQRRYAIGGLGTLHGHRFRSLEGDRVALVTVEVARAVVKHTSALFFTEAGTAWDEGSLFDRKIGVDAGAGIRFGGALTLLAARTVNDDDAETRVHFRVRGGF
jgi:outer membrane protein assembly factor BamA